MHALTAAVLSLAQAVSPAPAAGTAAAACLPGGAGYLTARLRGDVEAEIDWRGAALTCEGMSRPGAQGLRLRFAGTLPDGRRLGILLATPALTEGGSGHEVPVNVTVIVEGEGRFYGTQGTDRCVLDEVAQTPVTDPSVPPRSFRVEGRGFCTAPARALAGEGSLLVTRFDFAGQVTFAEDDGATPPVAPPAATDAPRAHS